ncbi:hypothetical protein Cob_v004233 [Colletotrichum orbiculare MAFF 240422]|uniref:Uncharacterized protein n=1 Tax=Colletotrichum orbiculare (strain 104-T / ATCC 96160 / CBS 514.97 / LARS 414 / MAFF 240422) TaxID=1213857 RepID=A0A484FYI5_COLOR|nr:hypothetical protein Cob_v004233 [Colletotrichum orbiculare MAFF 240422]
MGGWIQLNPQAYVGLLKGSLNPTPHPASEHVIVIEEAIGLLSTRERDHATPSPPPAVAHDLIPLRNHGRRQLFCRRTAAFATLPRTEGHLRRRRNCGGRRRPTEEAEASRDGRD